MLLPEFLVEAIDMTLDLDAGEDPNPDTPVTTRIPKRLEFVDAEDLRDSAQSVLVLSG